MAVLSSPSVSHSPMPRPCNVGSLLGFSSLSLKPPAFSNGAKKFHGVGLIRASVTVEQQVEKTKVALVRIGTRGRNGWIMEQWEKNYYISSIVGANKNYKAWAFYFVQNLNFPFSASRGLGSTGMNCLIFVHS
ncbi:porphobilinogen deaminase [Cucumis melo var. makuwa]|uniref:Porphobilinogen deaminase n=1 Tax=Cucumis melo var. makuwa TaxID=1194695 RepID=A0A5A7U8Y5_CUCMM|nr:porphobilinogen deaminase [Cucumis melo var. makuwa]TYK11550.1 porphobilinogen deaminase [Cucumis melo var. makuwa]